MIRYVRVKQFAAETGYTESAIRCKINQGVWLEGREFRKAPDGHILIDVEGYHRWVESANPGPIFGPVTSGSKQGSSPPPFSIEPKRTRRSR